MMFLGVEITNISQIIWNGLVGNGAPVPTENYLLNRTIETSGEFTYVYFERLVNGGPNDISLANCNFMMVGKGPLIKVTDSYLVLQHSVKPTFLENCVTIFEAIPVPTNYTFAINFAFDILFTEALNDKTSPQFLVIENLASAYVRIIKFK